MDELTEAHTTALVEVGDAMKSGDPARIRRAIAAYKKLDEQIRNAPDLHAAEVRRQQLAAKP